MTRVRPDRFIESWPPEGAEADQTLTAETIARWEAAASDARKWRISALVELRFHDTVRVQVRKPRWMPNRVYTALMRTIVVVDGPLLISTSNPTPNPFWDR